MNAQNANHAKLTGDWTIAGVKAQVERLTGYTSKTVHEPENSLMTVDCGDIVEIDMTGLQLLYVWLHCVRQRGLQPCLTNLPECMSRLMARLGVDKLFADTYPDLAA